MIRQIRELYKKIKENYVEKENEEYDPGVLALGINENHYLDMHASYIGFEMSKFASGLDKKYKNYLE